MQKLRKQNLNSRVWVSPEAKIGDILDKELNKKSQIVNPDPFLTFAKNFMSDPDKKKFIMDL